MRIPKHPLNSFLKLFFIFVALSTASSAFAQNTSSNNTTGNITYDSANRMLTFKDKTMTYDANGNMTSITDKCGTTTYTWNVRDQLIGIQGFKADCSPLTASFKYDALGRRIQKTINAKTIGYVYDGLNIVQEIENGAVTVNYIGSLNIDEPLKRVESNGKVRYYLQDALGSVIALIDENGIVKTQYIYDPFGNVEIIGEPSDNPFQYTGRENDGTGLYYYRGRYYSPELQRFISEDPIGLSGGINKYVYADNNPINNTDPLGLSVVPCPLTRKQFDEIMGKNVPDPVKETIYNMIMTPSIGPMAMNIPRSEIAISWLQKMVKGSALREFPSQYLTKAIGEIEKDAKAGIKAAQKAWKLITDKRFRK